VFVGKSFIRARSGEAEKNNTKPKACLGRIKYTSGRLVARWIGQRSMFRKMAMPWRSMSKERGTDTGVPMEAEE
jgi:hypothetical protein